MKVYRLRPRSYRLRYSIFPDRYMTLNVDSERYDTKCQPFSHMVSSMDLATCLAAGKMTLQAVTLTKTCITIYKKADSVYRWYRYFKPFNKHGYDDCVIIEMMSDGDDDGYMLMTCHDEKQHKGKRRNTDKTLCRSSKNETGESGRDPDRDRSEEHVRQPRPEKFSRSSGRKKGK